MILAFPAHRRGLFKATGPVIEEALRRGHRVYLVPHEEDKPGEQVTMLELSQRWPGAYVEEPPRMASRLTRGDALLGPSLYAMPWLPLMRRGYELDQAWENVTLPVKSLDMPCWASVYQQSLWRVTHDLAVEHGWITGSPMFDAFCRTAETNVGTRPYVLLMALKFPANSGAWRRYAYRWWGYFHLVQALRRLCEDRHWDLVVKTRVKNRDPFWLAPLADRVVYDTALWPYTAAEWMRHPALVVHFQSGAALEAAVAGVPQISVHLPHPHLEHYPAHEEVYWDSPGMQDWPGVVTGIGWETAIGYLDEMGEPPVVSPAERQAYVQMFLGFDDGKTAGRILDLVEGQA